jgi:hypothetical protein
VPIEGALRFNAIYWKSQLFPLLRGAKAMKRKVYYLKLCSPLTVGEGAIVIPVNHTSEWVSNFKECFTSTVVRIENDGTTFETLNSVYVLMAKEQDQKQDATNLALTV